MTVWILAVEPQLMLTFGGAAPMGAVPQMNAYATPGGSYGGSPAPGVYGAPMYPSGGSYAV